MTDSAYSVKRVSELLGIRQHGVLSLIRSGELRAVDVSLKRSKRPRWRILTGDLEGFLMRRTHQPAAPRRRLRRRPTTVKHYF